jgi:ATP-binding cassette, subfamily B (MDR/TAP), member 1
MGYNQASEKPTAKEREQIGVAATIVEHAVASIATVKAFNAQILELKRATESFVFLKNISKKLDTVWAFTSGVSQFVTMAMFVQGFWFGARLVREGRISPGNVMAVFWACLIALNNLQMCLPQFIILFRGKLAMTALLSLVDPQQNPSNSNSNPTSSSSLEKGVLSSKKLIPTKCSGSFALYNVTFAYPSRPSILILRDISIFLSANDTTFIVGSSGSGKSTLAHLLLKMYAPQSGLITFDESDITRLDNKWFRQHVACVGQQGAAGVVILDEKSVFENVAAAVLDLEEDNEWQARPSEKEVEEACRSALMHEFVRDLPMGYDTLLGDGIGVGLSGGQKQRLSIARARLRNPTVLILGAFSLVI